MTQVKAKETKPLTGLDLREKTVRDFFQGNRQKIESVLPSHLDANKLMRLALGEFRKNPKLLECNEASLFNAVMQASSVGLEPGSVLGQVYLVPFKGECQFILGYRGMITLARNSGEIVSIAARAIHEHDFFEFEYGLNERLVHRPAKGESGEFVGAYMVAHFKGGGHHIELMWKHEIDKIRDESAGYRYWMQNDKKGQAPIWHLHYEEMAKKTLIRRGFKWLPMSTEVQRIVQLDEAADRGEQNNVTDGEFEVVAESAAPAAPVSKAEALAATMAANGKPNPTPNPPFDLGQ